MRMHVLAVGTRMPTWVDAGFDDYAQRFPAHCRLELREIAAVRRGKNADLARIAETEAERLIDQIPERAHVVALERSGRVRSTDDLAAALRTWLGRESDIAFLIGGPEGLAPSCMKRAHEVWSLSALTLPHALARVLLAEQLYRAYSLVHNLPYHRGDR